MDETIIAPFIKTTHHLFATMLQLEVRVGQPAQKEADAPSYDVSGIISIAGDVVGSIVLSFREETATRVVSLFTGSEVNELNDDLCDAIGELVNMVAGGAKAQLQGKNCSISTPSVIIGSNHVVHTGGDVVCVSIPCDCDCGEFAIELAVKTADAPAASAA
ncbi:MAG: chemotaxis protein CheX [Planctomycetota bacterium]